jgi:hypothetical protein
MQQRVHQAFYRSKLACWDRCQKDREDPALRSARLDCVSQQCFEPAQEADHQLADSAGLTYEQACKLTLDVFHLIAEILDSSMPHSEGRMLADADSPADAGCLWRNPAKVCCLAEESSRQARTDAPLPNLALQPARCRVRVV